MMSNDFWKTYLNIYGSIVDNSVLREVMENAFTDPPETQAESIPRNIIDTLNGPPHMTDPLVVEDALLDEDGESDDDMYLTRIGYLEEEKPKSKPLIVEEGFRIWGQNPCSEIGLSPQRRYFSETRTPGNEPLSRQSYLRQYGQNPYEQSAIDVDRNGVPHIRGQRPMIERTEDGFINNNSPQEERLYNWEDPRSPLHTRPPVPNQEVLESQIERRFAYIYEKINNQIIGIGSSSRYLEDVVRSILTDYKGRGYIDGFYVEMDDLSRRLRIRLDKHGYTRAFYISEHL